MILNDKLTYLDCYDNLLISLTLTNKLETVYCDINVKLKNINNKTNIKINY